MDVRYAEYNVIKQGGQQTFRFRGTWREYDRGVVQYDARGDLAMTSECIHPLTHSASAVAGRFQMRFRVPGENTILDLFYRREPE